ncbi:MAG: hypothetical protein A2176_15500 [Spirochaetes bacterium RBG_13_51_14]|nr:MAG: hypothetical protein A2176_15500 [Spirochaetes bacterium RBG_13_51_14]
MRQIKRVAIIGAGSWGTAVAKNIAESKPHITVRFWAHEKPVAASINTTHENAAFLPGVKLPPNITATNNLKEALDGADVVLLATPSRVVYDMSQRMGRFIMDDMHVGFLTKGFCKVQNEILTISQTMERAIPRLKGKVVAISGPSHAEEVSLRFHTCLNVASTNAGSRAAVASLLESEYLRCRETEDIRGVEVGGTLKNPAAIAAGMISALPRCGDNLAGALISEALKEMVRLAEAFNISRESMLDISGLGDLVATALSRHSRNRRFGRDIAGQIMTKGRTLSLWDRMALRIRPESVIERMSEKLHYLAEGAYAIEPIIDFAESKNISIPVYRALYEVLLNKKDPSLLIETIKNPERFDELFFSTKIHISDRKKGLERVKGKVFRSMIISLTVEKFLSNQGGGSAAPGPAAIIRTLREINGAHAGGSPAGDDGREAGIIARLNSGNYAESVRQLSRLYINGITDNFHSAFKWIFFIFIAFIRIAAILKRKKGGVTISGRLDDVRRIKQSVNILYVADNTEAYHPIFPVLAMVRKRLPYPRFFIDADATHPRDIFVLKRCGGFVVDTKKLSNPVYRETLCSYLSTLAGHGVPILYFTSRGRGGSDAPEWNEFLSAVTETLYRHAVELALIPVEISYLRRPAVVGGRAARYSDLLSAGAHVHFSKPIYLSEYTKQPHMIIGLSGIIATIWKQDRKIFPHHLLCKILADNNFSMKSDTAVKLARDYMGHAGRRFDYAPAKMVKKGARFLEDNGIATQSNGSIIVLNRELAEYYAGLLE